MMTVASLYQGYLTETVIKAFIYTNTIHNTGLNVGQLISLAIPHSHCHSTDYINNKSVKATCSLSRGGSMD